MVAPTPADASEVRSSPAPDPLAVSVRGLRMRYGDRDVLRGVDLDIRRGEVLALLGPNGAGKSTTIEILEGFRRRSEGEVRVLGHDPQHAGDDWRARVGIVMQSWRDHARWRVRELLDHFARYYRNARTTDELLTAVGLTDQATQECHRLSGGQRRRLDVALGIIGRPELLFLDEPTTGFDPESRFAFHELIERLRATDNTTILLTTHDLVEAERLSDSIAVLINGRLITCGPAGKLVREVGAEAEVRWVEEGSVQRQFTSDPSRLVWELHCRIDGPIDGLEIRRPTLEDTYLRLLRQEQVP
jgi:ABC-2 type transport system ATP-binding protein